MSERPITVVTETRRVYTEEESREIILNFINEYDDHDLYFVSFYVDGYFHGIHPEQINVLRDLVREGVLEVKTR